MGFTPAAKFDLAWTSASRITNVRNYWTCSGTDCGGNLTLFPQMVTHANIIAEMTA